MLLGIIVAIKVFFEGNNHTYKKMITNHDLTKMNDCGEIFFSRKNKKYTSLVTFMNLKI